jgi:hypothetical protein
MEIRVGQSWRAQTTAVVAVALINAGMVSGFANPSLHPFGMPRAAVSSVSCPVSSVMSQLIKARNKPKQSALFMVNDQFQKLEEDDDNVISFIDMSSDGEKAIDCYVDSVATVDGVEYTIGSPCDYAVALCYFDEDDQLVPIELDDPLMDDIFPVAEGIIEDEFGEELVLLRTPQTLTLIGELEESEADDDEDVEDDEDGEVEDTEEEVEILVSFEEDGQEYHLVRLLDPILLVGKVSFAWFELFIDEITISNMLDVNSYCYSEGRE